MKEPQLRLVGQISSIGELKDITTNKDKPNEKIQKCLPVNIYERSFDKATGKNEYVNTRINLLGKAAEKFDLKEKDAVSFSILEIKTDHYEKDGVEKTSFFAYSTHYSSLTKEFFLEPKQPPMEAPKTPQFENENEVGVFGQQQAEQQTFATPPADDWDESYSF